MAIDLETEDYEVDVNEIAACDRLEARHPEAQIWMVRIGSRHVRRFGGRIKNVLPDNGSSAADDRDRRSKRMR